MMQTSNNNMMDKTKMTVYKLGAVEVIFGCIFFIINVIQMIMAGVFWIGPGSWCSVSLFISGSLGIIIKNKPTACMYKANLVMSLISMAFMFVLLTLSIFPALILFGHGSLAYMFILLTLGSLVMIVVCILHAVYSGLAICGCCRKQINRRNLQSNQQAFGLQYIQTANGEYMMVPTQIPVTDNTVPSSQAMPFPVIPLQPNNVARMPLSPVPCPVDQPQPNPMMSSHQPQVTQPMPFPVIPPQPNNAARVPQYPVPCPVDQPQPNPMMSSHQTQVTQPMPSPNQLQPTDPEKDVKPANTLPPYDIVSSV